MPIWCVDGEVSDVDLALWEVRVPTVRIALTCEEVRAVFLGPPLSRGLALLKLSRAQFDKLFPDRSRRKNPYNLMRYARRIQGAEAQRALANASVRQLEAAARHDGDDAQINAAIRWTLGFDRT